MSPLPELQSRLQSVRSHYLASPWINTAMDDAPLLRSWQRCLDAGMQPHEYVNFELVSRSQLSELDDVHGELVRQARPETERLAQALRGTGCAVMLFNPRGVVIDRLCHESATHSSLLQASRVGMNVSERCVGTTAPSIALHEGVANLVGRDAHFFAAVRPFFCVAAPIDNPHGQRLAALDITSYDDVPGFDVFSLVVDAAVAIENSLFRPTADRMVVHFHPRASLVGTPMEGLLLVDDRGTVLGANRMAARLLSQQRQALLGRAFADLFDRRLSPLLVGRFDDRGSLVEMRSAQGLQVMARFECEPLRRTVHRAVAPLGVALPGRQATAAVPAPPAAAAPMRETDALAHDLAYGLAHDQAIQEGHGSADSSADLPASAQAAPSSLRELEIQAIERALQALGGNVTAAARQLGISRNTIYRRLQHQPGTEA